MTGLRTTRSIALALALLVAGASVALACSDTGGDGPNHAVATSTQQPSTGAPQTPDGTSGVVTFEDVLRKDGTATKTGEVTWGWMFEQSGALQGFGDPAGDGALLAVDEINEAGGFQVGDTVYTIRLVKHDTKSDVSQTIAIAQELVQDDGVKVIFGPAAIGDQESTQITQRAKVLHFCPCPRRELTTLADVETMQEQAPFAFQTLAAPSRFLPPGARNAREEYPQFDTFATMCASSVVGIAFCELFEDAYESAGFRHVGREEFPPETIDFNPFLTRLKGKGPDIILNFVDAGPEQFTLLRQSWQLDVGELYIAVELEYELFETLVGGPGIRNKIVSAGAAPRGHAQYTSDDARIFFEEKYRPFKGGSLPPAAFAALLTYDPVYMLIAAMQRAGTVEDTEAIAQALTELHFDGYGEDDLIFDARHVIVTGNDSCRIYQGEMTCRHYPPPPLEE